VNDSKTPQARILLALVSSISLGLTFHGAQAGVLTGLPKFSNPSAIDNPFFPFQPGGMKTFAGSDHGTKTAAVDLYLTETREFLWNGSIVKCRVLREIAFEDGELVESSDNYFAQADDGTVYYFGEVVDNYVDGVIDNHGGSWLVGGPTLPSDPAESGAAPNPAVFMPADPQVGDVFKPEDLFPIVDETAKVVATDVDVIVPGGKYDGAITIQESSRLAPGTELKWYAPGVGVVKVRTRGETLRLESSTLTPGEDTD
jgi:hypothetical protein